MNKYVCVFLAFLFAGCASPGGRIKATSPSAEVVEADGMAPIVNGDVTGAKKTALHEALKNALGLVVGVYVSQEALVSKAVLIEDSITSQTEGYVEKYDVLKEWRENDFYMTRVKALVRKEDLSAKIRALELEPKKLGNPLVRFSIDELVDGSPAASKYAEDELKQRFIEQGFTVSDEGEPDILVQGRAESSMNTDAGLGGLISYRAAVSVRVVKAGSGDVMTTASATLGGIGVTKSDAAKTAILNGAHKIGADLPSAVQVYLRERAVVSVTIGNVASMNQLNDFIRTVRVINEIRDCRVRTYANEVAVLDLDMKKGTSGDVARRLEQMDRFKLKINKTGAYDVEATLVK
jgi:hypothetical protein